MGAEGYGGTSGVRLKLDSSEYLRVFLWLEFSLSLTLNKTQHNSKVSYAAKESVDSKIKNINLNM